MSIRCLNCGTMHPYIPPVHGGVSCLLFDSNEGPVLVDTGFGIRDYQEPTRLMSLFLSALRCPRDIQETAFYQVGRFGFQPEEVQHIVMTHLHLDHAGGLPDFPEAQIHLFGPEYEHIASGQAGLEYIKRHWEHGPRWTPYDLEGDRWYDFEAVHLQEFEPEIWLIPFTGHTAGHCAVAVQNDGGWVMHAGDAVPFNVGLDRVPDRISGLLLGPHTPRIRQFMHDHPEVRVVGAHMDLAFYDNWENESA